MTPAPLRLLLVFVLGSALASTGCSVTFGGDSEDSRGGASSGEPVTPLVRNEKATIDLRTKPTRESLGFRPGSAGAFYDRKRGSDGIRVTMLLPDGKSVEILAFSISSVSETDPLHPAPKGQLRTPPYRTIINARHPSSEAAKATLTEQADALGLDRERLAETEARPGVIAGTVLDGLRRDWLNVEAEIRTDEDLGEVIVNYLLSYDAQTLPPRP